MVCRIFRFRRDADYYSSWVFTFKSYGFGNIASIENALKYLPVGKAHKILDIGTGTSVLPTYIMKKTNLLIKNYYVMKKTGLDIANISILHIDNTYFRNGDIDLKQLFNSVSVTNYAIDNHDYLLSVKIYPGMLLVS